MTTCTLIDAYGDISSIFRRGIRGLLGINECGLLLTVSEGGRVRARKFRGRCAKPFAVKYASGVRLCRGYMLASITAAKRRSIDYDTQFPVMTDDRECTAPNLILDLKIVKYRHLWVAIQIYHHYISVILLIKIKM